MRLLSFFILLLPVMANANPEHWRQFHLKIFSKKTIVEKKGADFYHSSCTGTLLNINNSCRLVANAHCFKAQDDYVAITASSSYMFPEHQYDLPIVNQPKTTQYDLFYKSPSLFVEVTTLKKHFITKDLAEIKVSEKLSTAFCKDLKPVDLKVLNKVETKASAYAALGFFMGVETVSFTGDKEWNRWKEKVKLEIYPPALNIEKFYHVPKLTTFKGMSGGLLINDDLMPIGILTRHIPYQEESFVIGLEEVAKFLSEEAEPTPPNPEIYFEGNPLVFRRNSDGTVGNEHGNGGNEHGNGGNEHGNGTDTKSSSKKTLLDFRLPEEGVIDPFDFSRIILNVCGKQIDGYEDYVLTKECKGEKHYRKKNEYPEHGLRLKTLSRILEEYNHKLLRGDGTKIFYFEQANYLSGWRKFAKGDTTVTASASPGHLFLRFKSKNMFRLIDKFSPPKGDNRFDLYFFTDPDGKNVIVALQWASEKPNANGKGTVYSFENVEMSCRNNNLLKLICSDANDKFEFALSKKESAGEALKYRIAHRTGLNFRATENHEVVTYYYGELKVDEKGKLSDLPVGGQIFPGL